MAAPASKEPREAFIFDLFLLSSCSDLGYFWPSDSHLLPAVWVSWVLKALPFTLSLQADILLCIYKMSHSKHKCVTLYQMYPCRNLLPKSPSYLLTLITEATSPPADSTFILPMPKWAFEPSAAETQSLTHNLFTVSSKIKETSLDLIDWVCTTWGQPFASAIVNSHLGLFKTPNAAKHFPLHPFFQLFLFEDWKHPDQQIDPINVLYPFS